jgi:fumarate hydratase class I
MSPPWRPRAGRSSPWRPPGSRCSRARPCATSRTCSGPGHLAQLAKILDDPEASRQRPLRRARPAEERQHRRRGVLPVPGHRHRHRRSARRANTSSPAAATRPSRAGSSTPTRPPTCATRSSPRWTCTRRSTPATTCRRRSSSTPPTGDAYKLLFMAKGGGSANKSYLYQETKACSTRRACWRFVDQKLRTLGTAACPPYHLAIVIGGTSAEYALKTAKLASRATSTPPRPRATRSAAASATAPRGRRCSR